MWTSGSKGSQKQRKRGDFGGLFEDQNALTSRVFSSLTTKDIPTPLSNSDVVVVVSGRTVGNVPRVCYFNVIAYYVSQNKTKDQVVTLPLQLQK